MKENLSNRFIDNFPKNRPILSRKIQEIYKEHYKSNRSGDTAASSLAQKLEAWMHKKVASTKRNSPDEATLELGAGTLNQIPYEFPVGQYDIVEPMENLYVDSPHLNHMRNKYHDIDDVPINLKYKRITSVAVLEHLTNLPEIIAKSCRLLDEGGCFCAGIPNEGKFLWGLAWRVSTGFEFRVRYGADYGELMRHEHVNTADEIEEILKYFFEDVSCEILGPTKTLALYRYIECRTPNKNRADEYLNNL